MQDLGDLGANRGSIHPEQMKLLWGADGLHQHFILAHLTEGRSIFVFGRTIRMPEWLDIRGLLHDYTGRESEYAEVVQEYLTKQAIDWRVPAETFSVDDPEGTFHWFPVRNTWPISPTFYTRAEEVGWSLTHPLAPMEELEATMRRFRRLINAPSNGA